MAQGLRASTFSVTQKWTVAGVCEVNDSAPYWPTTLSLNKAMVDVCCGLPPGGLPVCVVILLFPTCTHTEWDCHRQL